MVSGRLVGGKPKSFTHLLLKARFCPGFFYDINSSMANKFTRFLSDVGRGVLSPRGQMGNWQHATRMFIDDSLRLAPKTKFNYFVRIELNKAALKAPSFSQRHIEEVGLLVKNCDLPKFQFDTETMNQYNRKKLIYKMINYQPVNLTFHDDNQGVVNALWALYYGYYIADRQNPTSAYSSTQYMAEDDPRANFRYGLDNNKSPGQDLIKSISIYTMGRRRFIGYTLVNPRITQWQHGTMDYAEGSMPAESAMTVEYEAVQYSSGIVEQGSPKGFATLHYDNVPSPLSIQGGGVSNLFGTGGILDGLETVFGALGDGSAFSSGSNFLQTAVGAINTYKNIKNYDSSRFKSEAINILTNPSAVAGITNTVTGLIGSVFPRNSSTTTTTTATPRNITGGF